MLIACVVWLRGLPLTDGRKPIQTLHKFDTQLTSLYQSIRRQINMGRQVYIVFPLIKESEKSDLKNLEEGFETLKEAFPDYNLSKVHGKMKPAEKETEMEKFDGVCNPGCIYPDTQRS